MYIKSSICGIQHTCIIYNFPYNYKNRVLACFQTRPSQGSFALTGIEDDGGEHHDAHEDAEGQQKTVPPEALDGSP